MTKRCEQETVISRTAGDTHWHVWSNDRRMFQQILRLAVRLALQAELGGTEDPRVEIWVPANQVQFVHVHKANSKLEGEKREALVRRLRLGRERARIRRAKSENPGHPERSHWKFHEQETTVD